MNANIPPEFANRILIGDAAEQLARLPAGCVDTIVTSPPYFRQRDYSARRQIGQEERLDDYVGRLVSVFQAARPVLKQSGSLWLVLGDKYVDGELQGAPWRVALALQGDGWRLRSDVIWHKPNARPSAVKSRPTTDHEYVFLFTRSEDYFYDADAIREPHVTFSPQSRMKGGRKHFGRRGGTPESGKNSGDQNLHDGRWDQAFHPLGRNKRTVWSIPLGKFRGAHFSVFPETLAENCIRAASPAAGVVLDPFLGSGTTAAVARRLGRTFVGIEINPDYARLAEQRLHREVQGC